MTDDETVSSPHKVVNSVIYRQGRRVRELAIEAISDVVQEPVSFIWVGLHNADPSLLLKMQEEFGLHELAVEDAMKAHQRSKLESFGSSLFIVVKTAQMHEADVVSGETHFFVGSNFLVSVRHGLSQGYVHVRSRAEQSPQMLAKGPAYALYALLDFIVDNFQPVMAHLETEFEQLEADIFKGRFRREAIERLYELKTQLHTLRNAVEPIEDIAQQLMRLHPDLVPRDMLP